MQPTIYEKYITLETMLDDMQAENGDILALQILRDGRILASKE